MRALAVVARLGLILIKGLLRFGVVMAVYAISTIATIAVAVMSSPPGWQSMLLAVVVGALLPSFALTFGFLAWLAPGTARLYWTGGDPESDYVTPRPLDSLLFVGATVALFVGAALWMQYSTIGFLSVAAVSTITIVAVGAAKIAELRGHMVVSALELLAGS